MKGMELKAVRFTLPAGTVDECIQEQVEHKGSCAGQLIHDEDQETLEGI